MRNGSKKKLEVLVPFHRKNLSKFVEKSVCHGSHCKWSEYRMRPLCHRSHPWPNQLKWYSIIICVPESQNDQIQPQTLVYALIKSVKVINPTSNGIKYYEEFGSMDLNQVKCVIGRIMDCGRWAIVNRSTSSACMHATI